MILLNILLTALPYTCYDPVGQLQPHLLYIYRYMQLEILIGELDRQLVLGH